MQSIMQISNKKVNAATNVPLLVDRFGAEQSAFLFAQPHVNVIVQADLNVVSSLLMR